MSIFILLATRILFKTALQRILYVKQTISCVSSLMVAVMSRRGRTLVKIMAGAFLKYSIISRRTFLFIVQK